MRASGVPDADSLSVLVAPRHTALVLVDTEQSPRDAVGPEGPPNACSASDIAERTRLLVEAARSSGVMVVWLQGPSTDRDRSGSMQGGRGTPSQPRTCGEDARHVLPAPGEAVIHAPRASGFVGTMLDLTLDEHDIRTCVFAGMGTEIGIEATARSAAFHNYHPVIAEDCISSQHPERQQQSLTVMRTRFDLVSSTELVGWWQANPCVRPRLTRMRHGPDTLEEMIAPSHTALIVVDMQNDFCDPQGDYGQRRLEISQVRAIVPTIANLVRAARQAGAMVFWIRALCLPDHLSDSAATRRFISRHHDRPYILPETWGQEIIPELEPRTGEPIIDKFRSDAFVGTPLHLFLDCNAVRTVVLTGVVTHGCVESTAQSASFNNYSVVCVEDAMASPYRELHDAAVALMRARYRVATSREVRDAWNAWR